MGNDLPQFKGRTVMLWLCLDPNAKCGLWYADKAQATKNRDRWVAVIPVLVPAAIYARVSVGLSDETQPYALSIECDDADHQNPPENVDSVGSAGLPDEGDSREEFEL